MTRPAQTALLALALLCWSNPVASQTSPAPAPSAPDPQLARIRTDFDYGNFADALKGANERIDRGNLTEAELIELHKYAGLSAFYIRQRAEAERHFWALLQLDPDYSLDPFLVPPVAIAFFEGVRKEHAAELGPIREERRRRGERQKEADEREQARAEAEQQRRQLEELARRASRARSQSFVLNFVPFGAGQFQQGRTTMGIIFAVSEGFFAVSSIAAYLAYDSLLEDRTIVLSDTDSVTQRGIPDGKQGHASAWRTIKYISAGGFWITYAVGVVDALIHHKPEILAGDASSSQFSPAQVSGLSGALAPPESQPRIRVGPSTGGLGARLEIAF